jgi:hypothetical protein
MQRQLIGHNSLHNTMVACVEYVIKPIKMYNVKILILEYWNRYYMFRPYKAIIRHHINEDSYPTARFLKIFFSSGLLLCFYILSSSAAIFHVHVCWCTLVRIMCFAFPVFTVKTGNARHKIKYRNIITSNVKRFLKSVQWNRNPHLYDAWWWPYRAETCRNDFIF